MLLKALGNAQHMPETIKTDSLKSSEGSIEDLFGADVKHIQSDGIRAAVNNNLSERLQGTFRARTKTLRGLDSRATGQTYLDGWVLSYNLLREHESLGDRTAWRGRQGQAAVQLLRGHCRTGSSRPPCGSEGPGPGQAAGTGGKSPKVVVNMVKVRGDHSGTVLTAKPEPAQRQSKANGAKPPKPLRRTALYHPFMRRGENRKRRRK